MKTQTDWGLVLKVLMILIVVFWAMSFAVGNERGVGVYTIVYILTGLAIGVLKGNPLWILFWGIAVWALED